MSRQEKELYEFGPFRLDPGQRLLLRDDKPVPLQAKAFDILLVLVRSSEQLVSKDDLMKVVWPDTFVEESNLTQNIFVLRKALGEKAGAYRYIVTVPSRGYRFAEKVRLISQEETLAIESRSRTRVVIQESRLRWRPWALRSGLPLIVVLCAVAVYQSSRIRQAKRSETVASPRIQTRRSVAVLGFQNLSGRSDPAWLSTALSEMLTTEIGGGDQVRMISAEEVAHLKNNLPLLGGTLSKGTLTQIRRDLGADIVVLGSFSDLGKQSHGKLRLDLQIQDTRAGETVATLSETGTEDELFQLVSRTGAHLREKLSVPAISGDLVARVQAAMPSNTESARLYAEGLEKIRQFDALSGKDLLQRSIAADPSYAPAHSALAEAWSQLGYEGKATAEAHTAFELSDKLAHKDRLYIEATYRRMNKEWGKAIGLYQALFDFFPDDVEYGLRLADAQTQSGNGRDVEATIALLRKLPPPANDDVRIDLAEEMNYIRRGEYSTARSVAVAAVEKARANGLDLPLARALYLEAATVAPLGEGDKAIAAAEEAKKIYQRVGDQWGVSNTLEYIAYVRATHGEWDEAEKIYRQALAINRSIGSKTGAAIDLTSIAAAHEARGDLQGGKKMDEEALAIYREIGDRSREGWALLGIGRAVAEDDPIEGLKLDEQALAAFKDVGDDNGTADVMYEKISELIVLGKLSEADEACRQSLDLAHKSGVKRSIVSILFYQGTIAKLEGKLEEANRRFSEALATDRSDAQLSSEIELGLAQVADAEGHLLEAKQHANQSSTYIAQQSSPGDEIGVKAFIAILALESGDAAEAARSLSAAQALLSKSQEHEAHFIFDIANARIKAAGGLSGEARRLLQGLIAETTQHKNVRYQLEGRLALCEIEAKTDLVSARTHAKMLEQDAASRGFGWIARKAHAVSG